MIKGNVIELGYGDVLVSSDCFLGILEVQNIKPPYPPGTNLTPDMEYELLGERICIPVNLSDASYLDEVCKEVRNGELSSFPFRGYVFDFSNYNEESFKVFVKNTKNAMMGQMMLLAC